MDTLLYDVSIPAISSLQDKLTDQAGYMQLMSVVFDPKYAFLVYSPIVYLCNRKVGKKLILTVVIAEWLNMVLKWMLHGERPYWYVHSSGHFDPQQVPIKQFPITCELGPGHPSGHSMVTAAVWFIILDSLLQAVHSVTQLDGTQQLDQQQEKPAEEEEDDPELTNDEIVLKTSPVNRLSSGITVATWILYVLLLANVAVSRVFLGCHFPHQCLAGAILGLLVAKWVSSLETKPRHFIGASAFLLVSAFATFGLLQVLGFDPAWTIKLATTHCEKREYIHLDTAPFFSIMRYCGFALGCGLGLLVPLRSYAHQLVPDEGKAILADDQSSSSGDKSGLLSTRNLYWLALKILMAMLMARQVDNLAAFVSHTNLPIFYSSAFLAYTLFSFAIVAM